MTSKKSSSENSLTKAVIICGPTGSGKSTLAMNLARKYGGQIIAADSRQIYKRLDIGTAKPTLEERRQIPHHMIDLVEVSETFTAKIYAQTASRALREVAAAGDVPFIVGGAGLYLSALTRGLFEGSSRNEVLRTELEELGRKYGTLKLHEMLLDIDPESAALISPNDKVRLIRAIEVFKQTGEKLSALKKAGRYGSPTARYLWLGLTLDRQALYERINSRVDSMMEMGLVEEVVGLRNDGLGNHLRQKKIVGYYEIVEVLDGVIPLHNAVSLIKQHSRNYAKKQLTWFRNKTPARWLFADDKNLDTEVCGLLDDYLKNA